MEETVFLVGAKSFFQVNKNGLNISLLKKAASAAQGVEENSLYLTHNGKILQEKDGDSIKDLQQNVIRFNTRLPGGKGGFGSMLRALGAQIEKTTNREACRDLSGRRMRDVNNEKKISDWLDKEKKDEEDRAKKKKEKLERILNPPKHRLEDSTYVNEIKVNAEKVDDALRQGFERVTNVVPASSTLGKRGHKNRKGKAKKQKMWLEIDEAGLSSENDSGDDEVLAGLEEIASPVDKTTAVFVQDKSNAHQIDKTPVEALEDKDITPITTTETGRIEKSNLETASIEKTDNVAEKSVQSFESKIVEQKDEPINIGDFTTADELEAFGLEKLKNELSRHGLKCGGTLEQRAQRLFLLKETPVEQLDVSLFAKPKKGKQLKKK